MKIPSSVLSLAFGAFLLPVVATAQARHDMHAKHATMADEAMTSGWKELDTFHMVMAATWHPITKSNDFKPIREKAGALSAAAKAWGTSKYPSACDTKTIRDAITDVVAGSTKVAEMVEKHATNAKVKTALKNLHMRFEVVEEGCKPSGK